MLVSSPIYQAMHWERVGLLQFSLNCLHWLPMNQRVLCTLCLDPDASCMVYTKKCPDKMADMVQFTTRSPVCWSFMFRKPVVRTWFAEQAFSRSSCLEHSTELYAVRIILKKSFEINSERFVLRLRINKFL